MEWGSIVELTVSFVAGGVLNWLFSRQASKELRREAGELRHFIDVLAVFLESLELDSRISIERDETTGRITHVRAQRSAGSSSRGSSRAAGTLQHRQDQDAEGAEEG